jgi:hypothetical protein
LWTRHVIVLAVAGRRVEAVAATLAAVSGARVDQRAGGLAEAASAAGAEDLLVLGLSTEQVATGRLAQEIVASIGVAPCPVVLVGPAQRVEA